MTDYAGFAPFYDRIMGDRSEDVARIQAYISRHLPAATSLLELGCGTGALLRGLAPQLSVTGLDRSPEMLAIAASRVPQARLVQADMTAFRLPDRFDVVICMFDTLNHVPEFADWLTLFSCVHEHLAEGGLFIFDVNTTGRLRSLDGAPPYLDEFDGNVVIMTVRSAGDWLSLWRTRIFEHRGDDLYRLHDERIYELGVPLDQLRAALAGRFTLLEEASLDGSPASDDSDRVFFAYRHASAPPGSSLMGRLLAILPSQNRQHLLYRLPDRATALAFQRFSQMVDGPMLVRRPARTRRRPSSACLDRNPETGKTV